MLTRSCRDCSAGLLFELLSEHMVGELRGGSGGRPSCSVEPGKWGPDGSLRPAKRRRQKRRARRAKAAGGSGRGWLPAPRDYSGTTSHRAAARGRTPLMAMLAAQQAPPAPGRYVLTQKGKQAQERRRKRRRDDAAIGAVRLSGVPFLTDHERKQARQHHDDMMVKHATADMINHIVDDQRRDRAEEYRQPAVSRAFNTLRGAAQWDYRPEDHGMRGDISYNVARNLSQLGMEAYYTKAPSTWLKLGYSFNRAMKWIAREMKLAGLKPTIGVLANHVHFVVAYLVELFNQRRSSGVINSAVAAINAAFTLRGYPTISENQEIAHVRTLAKRRNDRPSQPKEPMRPYQIRAIMRRARNMGRAGLAKRVVALAAALMFDLCIRYDELARLKTDALFFVPNGVLVLVGIRKNKQAGTQCFLPISDTGPTGTVALLRSVLLERGFSVPRVGRIQSERGKARMLWPMLAPGAARGSTLVLETSVPRLTGPNASAGVNGRAEFVRLLREDLRAVFGPCGFDKSLVKSFAAHSLRRGANLHRFINNMPLDMRMELGGWRCLTVEAGYRACNARRRMQAVVGFQI